MRHSNVVDVASTAAQVEPPCLDQRNRQDGDGENGAACRQQISLSLFYVVVQKVETSGCSCHVVIGGRRRWSVIVHRATSVVEGSRRREKRGRCASSTWRREEWADVLGSGQITIVVLMVMMSSCGPVVAWVSATPVSIVMCRSTHTSANNYIVVVASTAPIEDGLLGRSSMI